MAKTKKVELYRGTAKESGKEFKSLKITIGDWSALYFPKSKFEMDYIEKYLESPEEGSNFLDEE